MRAAFPETPAGGHARWFWETLSTGAAHVVADDVASHLSSRVAAARDPQAWIAKVQSLSWMMRGGTVLAVRANSPTGIEIDWTTGRGLLMELSLHFDAGTTSS